MHNDWFTIGPVTVHGYGVMIAIGILAAFFVGERQAKKYGLNPEMVDDLVFVCLISGFLGAKILYCLTNFSSFIANPVGMLFTMDGWVVYGGIIGGILGAYAWCRHKKESFTAYANMLFPCVALAQGFGRIGCFFAGCCYGKETTSSLGITFSNSSFAPNNVTLIPTQLIMSLGDFLLFAILFQAYKNEKYRNDVTGLYLMLYSAGRFIIEFMRGDTVRGFVGVLSTSQFIGIFTFALGLVMIILNHRKPKSTDAVNA